MFPRDALFLGVGMVVILGVEFSVVDITLRVMPPFIKGPRPAQNLLATRLVNAGFHVRVMHPAQAHHVAPA